MCFVAFTTVPDTEEPPGVDSMNERLGVFVFFVSTESARKFGKKKTFLKK